jgi:superfamily II DNA or RNA helicase
MPTGTGKTVTFAKIIDDQFAVGVNRAVVLAHREELLDQARDKIERVVPGLNVGIEAASRRSGPMDDVVVASVQTIGRQGSGRLDALRNCGLLIIDEAHHACAESYQIVMDALGSYEGDCFTIGVTATPKRLDNKPLFGNHDAVFEEEVFRYELRTAIDDGYLCNVRGFRVETSLDLSGVRTRGGEFNQSELQKVVDTEERNQLAIDAWCEIARDRKTVVFCTGVDHARHVAAMFTEIGVKAESVDGTLDKDTRRGILGRFRSGETQVLCNVEVLTEGFDEPALSCILMLRPTQSWGMFCQMVGRGTRVLPGIIEPLENQPGDVRRRAILESGKPDCIVIDVVDLTSKHELASVPALLGLPPRLDMEGKTLTETAEAMDELGAAVGAVASRNPRRFTDIQKMLNEVDLLATTVVPESIKRASRFGWLQSSPGEYTLDCGPTKDGSSRRVAFLSLDALGHHVLKMLLKRPGHGFQPDPNLPELRVSNDLTQAIRDSDRVLVKNWEGMGVFAIRDQKWKTQPATAKQVAVLRKMKVDIDRIPNLTAGQANALISQRVSGRR